jgi:hypothetical protein
LVVFCFVGQPSIFAQVRIVSSTDLKAKNFNDPLWG